MKRIYKIFIALSLFALLFSILGISASAENVTTMSSANFYVGEVLSGGNEAYAGQSANVFFAQHYSTTEVERAIVIENYQTKEAKKFTANSVGVEGKFGIAIYNIPEGVYTATLYVDGVSTEQSFVFLANVGIPYSIVYDWNGASNHGQEFGFAMLDQKFINAPDTSVEGIIMPTNAVLEGWFTPSGEKFDFETDLYDHTFATLTAKYKRVEDISDKLFQTAYGTDEYWSFGNSTSVDLSDGSTLVMKLDVVEAYVPQANYNFFYHLNATSNLHGTETSQHFYTAYANYGYGEPFEGQYYTQNQIIKNDGSIVEPTALDGVEISGNWDPTQIFKANQSVAFTYTAPTENNAGSIIVYTKHIVGGEEFWSELCSVKGLTLDNVQRTDKVFAGIMMYKGQTEVYPTIKFTGYESYVLSATDGTKTFVPGFNVNFGEVIELENDFLPPLHFGENKLFDYSVDHSDGDQTFSTWIGNEDGVNLEDGESLTLEFAVDGVADGLWYNVLGGFMVYNGTDFALSQPCDMTSNAIGFMGNWALDPQSYNGRVATIIGDPQIVSGTNFASGYDLYDPYTDLITYNGEKQYTKVVYTAPSTTVPGNIALFSKIGEGEWKIVVQIENITSTSLTNDVRIAWFYNSGQNGGSSYKFELSEFKMYTSNSTLFLPLIGVGGDGIMNEVHTVNFTFNNESVGVDRVATNQSANIPTLPEPIPMGCVLNWYDQNGVKVNLDNIRNDMTVYGKYVVDPIYKAGTWTVTFDNAVEESGQLMTAAPADLSGGKTLSIEMDILEGIQEGNRNVGVMLWQYLPEYGTKNPWFSSFHDLSFYGNGVYTQDEDGYQGLWYTTDYAGLDGTQQLGSKFNPYEIFSTGKTVKISYTAPSESALGSIVFYTKTIGANEGEYVVEASITGLKTENVPDTTSVYLGLWCSASSETSMTVTNYHAYIEGTDIEIYPFFNYNNCTVAQNN